MNCNASSKYHCFFKTFWKIVTEKSWKNKFKTVVPPLLPPWSNCCGRPCLWYLIVWSNCIYYKAAAFRRSADDAHTREQINFDIDLKRQTWAGLKLRSMVSGSSGRLAIGLEWDRRCKMSIRVYFKFHKVNFGVFPSLYNSISVITPWWQFYQRHLAATLLNTFGSISLNL